MTDYIDIMKRALDILEAGGECPECNGEPDIVHGHERAHRCACEGHGHLSRIGVYNAIRGRWLEAAWDQTARHRRDLSFNGDDIPF